MKTYFKFLIVAAFAAMLATFGANNCKADTTDNSCDPCPYTWKTNQEQIWDEGSYHYDIHYSLGLCNGALELRIDNVICTSTLEPGNWNTQAIVYSFIEEFFQQNPQWLTNNKCDLYFSSQAECWAQSTTSLSTAEFDYLYSKYPGIWDRIYPSNPDYLLLSVPCYNAGCCLHHMTYRDIDGAITITDDGWYSDGNCDNAQPNYTFFACYDVAPSDVGPCTPYCDALAGGWNGRISAEDQTINTLTINAYINDKSGMLDVNITSDANRAIVLQIYDIYGRQIQMDTRNLSEGINNLEYDLSSYSSGAYFIKVVSDGLNLGISKFMYIK